MYRAALATLVAFVLMLSGAAAGAASWPTGRVEGTVTHEGRPVEGAVVSALGQSARTDGAGRFELAPVAVSGKYELIDVVVRARGLGVWKLSEARVLPDDTLKLTVELGREPRSLRQPRPRPEGDARSLGTSSYTTLATTGSHTVPPGTIRVYVTGSHTCDRYAEGTVKVVDYKQYLKHVLPNEWFASWEPEALRAGAMAVKGYSWYQVNRGGKWPDLGADVMDSTCDQVYNPAVAYASTDKAVDETWGYRITKDGHVHICQYWAGARDDGSKLAAGTTYAGRMSQWGSQYWAQQGKTWDWILNYYYDGTVISPTTDADLRLSSGPGVSSFSPVWGEPFSASFTVHNYGTQSMELNELYIKLRGPNGETLDLGGDNNSTPIAPGEYRTIRKSVPALGAAYPGISGALTLTATYRGPGGLLAPGLPAGGVNASTTQSLSLIAPTYRSSVASVSEASPQYYEGTTRDVYVKLYNGCNTTWRRAASTYHNAVRLATASPAYRQSPFYVSSYWLSTSRIAMQETAVKPGGTATFRVRLSGTVPPGSYTEVFRLSSDGSAPGAYKGQFGSYVTLYPTVLDDARAPSTTFSAPLYSTSGSDGLYYPANWSGKDSESGVASYEVQYYSDGAYRTWYSWTALTGGVFGKDGKPLGLVPGGTYTLRVRARDRAGNTSAWVVRRTGVPVDDPSLTYSGNWGSVQQSAYPHYRRTLHYSSTGGATAKYKLYGRRVAWIGTRGPDKGMAEVRIDGKLAATVDLYASAYTNRTVVFEKYLGATNGYHTVEIRVLGKKNTSSKGVRIDVDGIGVIR